MMRSVVSAMTGCKVVMVSWPFVAMWVYVLIRATETSMDHMGPCGTDCRRGGSPDRQCRKTSCVPDNPANRGFRRSYNRGHVRGYSHQNTSSCGAASSTARIG